LGEEELSNLGAIEWIGKSVRSDGCRSTEYFQQ
jgi:hypothetical protein